MKEYHTKGILLNLYYFLISLVFTWHLHNLPMQKRSKGGSREIHGECPRGHARWGLLTKTPGGPSSWGHRGTLSPKLWGATCSQHIISPDISFLHLLSCPLYLRRDCSHGRAFAEPELAWIFNGINNHCLQFCTAAWLPESLSVTGSTEMPFVTMPTMLLT